MTEEWISTAEAARRFGFASSSIAAAVRRGRIVGRRPGSRNWVVLAASVEAYARLPYRPDKAEAVAQVRDWFQSGAHGTPFDCIDDLFVAYRNSGVEIGYLSFRKYVQEWRKERRAVVEQRGDCG